MENISITFQHLRKIIFRVLLFFVLVNGLEITNIKAQDIWDHLNNMSQPSETYYLGDKLTIDYFVNFEVGAGGWELPGIQVGVGPSNTDNSKLNWTNAWYVADNGGSNKLVQGSLISQQFTSTGYWYFCARARLYNADPWVYANNNTWSNNLNFSPVYYFNVINLGEPSFTTCSPTSSNPSYGITLNWSLSNGKNVIVVRSAATISPNPNQGHTYSLNESFSTGSTVIVTKGNSTSYPDNSLTPNTTYYYRIFSENNSYYSPVGNEVSVTTTALPTIALSGSITEGAENGGLITVTLSNRNFASTLNSSNWSVTNLPTGVSKGTITRTSNTTATIALIGNRTLNYSSNITNATVTIQAAEIANNTDNVTQNSGFTFTAVNETDYTTLSASSLNQTTLNYANVSVTLTGSTFTDNILATSNFTLNNVPAGVTLSQVTWVSSTSCYLTLLYNNTTYTTDYPNFTLTINAAELTPATTILSTNNLTISNIIDLTMADDGNISEGAENGEVITVNLYKTGVTFNTTLTPANWSLINLPAGVTIGSVNRISATQATITLSGNRTTNYSNDITNATLTIPTSELVGASSSLTVNKGVTFRATSMTGNTVKKIVMQAFWWNFWNNNYPNSWANYLCELAPRLKALGIDGVWIPPTPKSTGTNSCGYTPFDHYDLGDKFQKGATTTRFGTKDEFLRMVAVMHANGIEVIQDVVLNHVAGAGTTNNAGGQDPNAYSNQYKNFRYACWNTPVPYVASGDQTSNETAAEYYARQGRWSMNWYNFHPQPLHNTEADDWTAGYWGPDICYGYLQDGTGNGWDHGGVSPYFTNTTYNPSQYNLYNRTEARNWLMWFKKQTAVDGFRWDAAKNFPYYVVQDLSWNVKYGSAMPTWALGNENMFNVAEFVGGKTDLDGYVDNVTYSNGGSDMLVGTFDFGLRGALYNMVSSGGFYDIGSIPSQQQDRRIQYYASNGTYVNRSTNFVNNHDTFRPLVDANGNYIGWDTGNELAAHIDPFDMRLSAAYAIALSMDGNLDLFFEDLFNVGGTSKRFTHVPTNATDLPFRPDLQNLLWCHQNLDFKDGAYKVRNESPDLLVIERSTKAIIGINDNSTSWQDAVIYTDFANGTVLHDYSGANSSDITVYGSQQIHIYVPPCHVADGSGRCGGYCVWAPAGYSGTYVPTRAALTEQEWEMENDLGDANVNSLTQGGETPNNSTTQRLVGKIFVNTGTTVTYSLTPKNSSNSLTLSLYDLNGNLLDYISGTGDLAKTYTTTYTGWIALKLNNTTNTTTGQGAYVRAAYTAPTDVTTSNYTTTNSAAIWTGNSSNVFNDKRDYENAVLPASGVDLILPTQNDLNPMLLSGSLTCANLNLGANRTITVPSGSTLTVEQTLTISTNATLDVQSGGVLIVSGVVYNNSTLEVKNGATLTFNNSFQNNGTLNVDAGSTITFTGNFVNNGTINLHANATQMASFIDNNTSFAGTANVELYLKGSQYNYLSAPLTNADAGLFVEGSRQLIGWSEPNYAWQWVSSGNRLSIGRGYSAKFVTGDKTISFAGNLNTGTFSQALTYTASKTNPGWNLVGNPYPSAMDWESSSITKTNIYNAIYFWNGTNYSCYLGSSPNNGNAYSAPAVTNNATRYIPSQQAFFVKVKDASGGTYGANNGARVHSSQVYYKSTESEDNVLRFTTGGNGYTDDMLIRLLPQSTIQFDDDYDAYKFFTSTASVPQIYSTIGSISAAINSVPLPEQPFEIPIGFYAGVAGDYSLKVTENTMNTGYQLLLDDLIANKTMDVSNIDTYNFSYKTTDVSNRFLLHFLGTPTSINPDETKKPVQIYSFDNSVYIRLENPEAASELEIYDLLGRKIFDKQINQQYNKVILIGNGYYIVKVATPKDAVVQKVFIK